MSKAAGPSTSVPVAALIALLAGGCGGPDLDADPSWAINWAQVTPTASGLEGYQMWELFVDGWEKDHDQAYFKCWIARSLDGRVVASPEGCPGCMAAYKLDFTDYIAGDAAGGGPSTAPCDATLQADPRFAGPPQYAVGALSETIAADAPYENETLGWYVGWDQTGVESFGYAYAAGLECTDAATCDYAVLGPGWVSDQTYVFWPAYAWELDAD
jgi:hypothetical protein